MADSPFNPFAASFGPGLDFMQTLMKNAGTALPGMGQWVTPTLDPQELDKRISELRTVLLDELRELTSDLLTGFRISDVLVLVDQLFLDA